MDTTPNKSLYFEQLEAIVLFGIIAFLMNLWAKNKGFFIFLPSKEKNISFKDVIISFAIYLGVSIIIAPIISRAILYGLTIAHPYTPPPIGLFGWIQLLSILFIAILLRWYFCSYKQEVFKKIWKDFSSLTAKSISYDLVFGVLSWLISFPVVVVVGQIFDMLIYFLFGVENYEQVAVRYLKMNLGSFPLLIVALLTIMLAAPVIEEFLFRGVLQNFFKKHLGTKAAILLSSLCFALFHLAPSQGAGNISLVASLFCFACFLGFIYEKQSSLFASIALHMTFNSVSTFRILLMPES